MMSDEEITTLKKVLAMWDDIYPDMESGKYPQERLEHAEFTEIAALRRIVEREVLAKASQQVQGDRELELEFTRIMSRINSVNFEFVNGEPEPAPRSGRSVPVILGVAWKVFRAAKELPTPKQEPVAVKSFGAWHGLETLNELPDGSQLFLHPAQPQAAAIPEGYMLVPIEPHRGYRYDAGLWSMRNWRAAIADQGK